MSFIRKLFGNEHSAPQTAPLAEERLITLNGAPDAAGVAAADAPPATESAPTPPAGSQRPWWEETAAGAPARNLNTVPLSPLEPLNGAAANPADEAHAPEPAPSNTAPSAPAPATPMSYAPHTLRGLAAAALRDIGQVRTINQDSVFSLITTVPREGSDFSLGLFIVADGMGGHDGGEVASRMAVNAVANEVISRLLLPALADNFTTDMQSVIVAAVQTANRAIWEHARHVGSDMGTTCTAALLLGHTLYVGHVGDSRLYVRTSNGLTSITDDHSAVGRLIQLGQLDASEAREHPLRSQLYRTVGQMPEVAVDYTYYPLGSASHLLLCSDGLWGLLEDDLLRETLDQHIWPHDTCRALIAHANAAGGDDNISAVVVTLPGQ